MKLLIAGSRSIKEFDLSPYIPEDTKLIITGGANGIDALAEEYADKHHLSKLVMRPEYKLYRKSAPLKRNSQMIEIADKVLIVWDGVSRGTKYTIDYAQKSNKEIKLVVVGNKLQFNHSFD